MTTSSYQPNINDFIHGFRIHRGLAFGILITIALFAFEIFNYSTTEFALTDLLGELRFGWLRWATILAIAFCGIDFAGIARLFAPEIGKNHTENWLLFSAWLLAATMNAMLTWWAVSQAILNRQTTGEALIARESMVRVVPVFVAILVWLIRVMIIGAFSLAGDSLFNSKTTRVQAAAPSRPLSRPQAAISGSAAGQKPLTRPPASQKAAQPAPAFNRPASRKPTTRPGTPSGASSPRLEAEYADEGEAGRSDPVYSPAPLAARSASRPPAGSSQPADFPAARTPVPPRRS